MSNATATGPAACPSLLFFVLVSLHVSGIMPECTKLIFVPPSFVLTGYPTIHRITIKPKARSYTSADPACSPQHMSKCAGSGLNCHRILLAIAAEYLQASVCGNPSTPCYRLQIFAIVSSHGLLFIIVAAALAVSFLVCVSSSFLIIRSHVIC